MTINIKDASHKKLDLDKKIDGFWKQESGEFGGVLHDVVSGRGNDFYVFEAYDGLKCLATTKNEDGSESDFKITGGMRIGVSRSKKLETLTEYAGHGITLKFTGKHKLANGNEMKSYDVSVTDMPLVTRKIINGAKSVAEDEFPGV